VYYVYLLTVFARAGLPVDAPGTTDKIELLETVDFRIQTARRPIVAGSLSAINWTPRTRYQEMMYREKRPMRATITRTSRPPWRIRSSPKIAHCRIACAVSFARPPHPQFYSYLKALIDSRTRYSRRRTRLRPSLPSHAKRVISSLPSHQPRCRPCIRDIN
jgi:hypothetical protein